jgi:antitoxin StbD
MSIIIPIGEANGSLAELVRDSATEPITLMFHGYPVGVILSARRYEALLEELHDLDDDLSVHQRDHLTVDAEELRAEL